MFVFALSKLHNVYFIKSVIFSLLHVSVRKDSGLKTITLMRQKYESFFCLNNMLALTTVSFEASFKARMTI